MKPVLAVLSLVVLVVGYFLYDYSSPEPAAQLSLRSLEQASIPTAAKVYIQQLDAKHPNEVLQQLYLDSQSEGLTESQCHEIAHEIGHYVFDSTNSLAEALQTQDVTCNGGYVHGVFERAFSGEIDDDLPVAKLCTDTKVGSFSRWQCTHGVGHGLMFANDQDVLAAVDDCTSYSQTDDAAACINGAIMQHLTLPLREFTDVELLTQCEHFSPPYNLDCYIYVPIAYLLRHQSDYIGALNWCSDNLSGTYEELCEFGVVSEATKRNISDIPSLLTLCESTSLTNNDCTRAIISMQLNHHASLEVVDSLCNQWPLGERQCRESAASHLLNSN